MEYTTPERQDILLYVYDGMGRLVAQEEQSSQAVTNEWTYDLCELVNGRYVI